MKRLIVNADDLGADEARNAGIFEAIQSGAVTSVSILPNGPALEGVLSRIHSLHLKNVSFGIHLNLSEGKPLSHGLRHLTGSDGSFLGKMLAQRLLMSCGDRELEEEIGKEIAAQILLLQSASVQIDHLDGHQHVHVFPAMIEPVIKAAKSFKIPWVRIPEESTPDPSTGTLSSAILDEARIFSGYARAARPIFKAAGLFSTDHFRGLYLKGKLPASCWIEFLEAVPNGLTEFMVHPGRSAGPTDASPFSGFSTAEREMELEALADGRFQAAILKANITLIPFPKNRE